MNHRVPHPTFLWLGGILTLIGRGGEYAWVRDTAARAHLTKIPAQASLEFDRATRPQRQVDAVPPPVPPLKPRCKPRPSETFLNSCSIDSQITQEKNYEKTVARNPRIETRSE